jgi:NADH-quinone oxidoreductase subunit L
MMAGTLAITGVGVEGLFGFAGFYSKDAIIESAYASGAGLGIVAFAVGVIVALLTSFYSWRLIFLTFFGKARWAGSEHIRHAMHGAHDGHGAHGDPPDAEDAGHDTGPHEASAGEVPTGTAGYHPHESPWTMLVPLALLSVGAVLAGMAFAHVFIEPEGAPRFWAGSIAFSRALAENVEGLPWLVKWSPAIAMLVGLLVALQAYVRHTDLPARFVAQFGLLYAFLLNKWYFDELYGLLFVRPALWLGRILWKKGDEGTIDRFGPDGAAALVAVGNRLTARLQSGYLYTYAFVMLIGLAAAATWAMMR